MLERRGPGVIPGLNTRSSVMAKCPLAGYFSLSHSLLICEIRMIIIVPTHGVRLQGFSTRGNFAPQHLAMSEDISCCHNWVWGG